MIPSAIRPTKPPSPSCAIMLSILLTMSPPINGTELPKMTCRMTPKATTNKPRSITSFKKIFTLDNISPSSIFIFLGFVKIAPIRYLGQI